MPAMHLWEIDHPYYCSEGADTTDYATFADFLKAEGDADHDMNLVFRWDWALRQDDDGNELDGLPPGHGRLELQSMLQRKGYHRTINIKEVTAEDEPAVREYLLPRMAHLLKLWQPLAFPTGRMTMTEAIDVAARTGQALRPAGKVGLYYLLSPQPGPRVAPGEPPVTLEQVRLCTPGFRGAEPASPDVADMLGPWEVIPAEQAQRERAAAVDAAEVVG